MGRRPVLGTFFGIVGTSIFQEIIFGQSEVKLAFVPLVHWELQLYIVLEMTHQKLRSGAHEDLVISLMARDLVDCFIISPRQCASQSGAGGA